MAMCELLRDLREKHHLTQEELAERVLVTRQAVSRWETGETQPNTETLKLLSREYDVSINTLLGSPRKLYCQCCGMPLNEDGMISREPHSCPLLRPTDTKYIGVSSVTVTVEVKPDAASAAQQSEILPTGTENGMLPDETEEDNGV